MKSYSLRHVCPKFNIPWQHLILTEASNQLLHSYQL